MGVSPALRLDGYARTVYSAVTWVSTLCHLVLSADPAPGYLAEVNPELVHQLVDQATWTNAEEDCGRKASSGCSSCRGGDTTQPESRLSTHARSWAHSR